MSINEKGTRSWFEAIVREEIGAWQGHPTWAWAGECGIFADHVWSVAREAGVEVLMDSFDRNIKCDSPLPALPGVTPEELERLGEGLNHVWLLWEGRHYDAAHPAGVESPFELRCVRQALVETLQMRSPRRLQQLCTDHAWWAESARLDEEFLQLASEREANYEEN